MRIKQHPILTIKQQQPIPFTFEGESYIGYPSDSIASALVANGIMVFSQSIKSKRPRGFYCAIGNCAACKMMVNGESDVRTCITPLQANMDIKRQTDALLEL